MTKSNKKGFTLIELIGVIVLISIMVLIIVPTVDKVIKSGQTTADNQLESNILLSAQNWASDNKSELNKLQKNWSYNLLISTLKEKGYIDKEIKLPSTKQEYTNNCVKITKTSDDNIKRAVYDYELELDNPDCNLVFEPTTLTITGKEDIANGKSLNSGQWTKENVRLTATSTNQNITNAFSYKWFNNNTRVDETNTNQHVVKVNNNEVKTFNYTATLTNGNQSTQSQQTPFVVKIDKKAPTINAAFAYSNANTITVTVDETNGSGLVAQNMLYAVSQNKPSTYNTISIAAGTKQILTVPNSVVTSLTSGSYYLWLKEGIKDSVGNISKTRKVGPITIDNTKPACTLTAPSSITYTQTGNYTLKCTDAGGSGLASQTLNASNFDVTNLTVTNVSAPSAITNGYQYTITTKANLGTGTGTLALKASSIKDRAGNLNDRVSANTSLARLKAATTGSCQSLTYNANSQTLAKGASNASYSNNSRTAAGSQTVTVNANANYAFSDGATSKTLNCSIARLKTATTGSCRSGLYYTGSAQTLAQGGNYVSYSNNSRTATGSQNVTVTADSNHLFSDGATSKTLSCSIADPCSSIKYVDGSSCSASCGGGTKNRLAYSTYNNQRCSAQDKSSGGSACNTHSCCSASNPGGCPLKHPCRSGNTRIFECADYDCLEDTLDDGTQLRVIWDNGSWAYVYLQTSWTYLGTSPYAYIRSNCIRPVWNYCDYSACPG